MNPPHKTFDRKPVPGQHAAGPALHGPMDFPCHKPHLKAFRGYFFWSGTLFHFLTERKYFFSNKNSFFSTTKNFLTDRKIYLTSPFPPYCRMVSSFAEISPCLPLFLDNSFFSFR